MPVIDIASRRLVTAAPVSGKVISQERLTRGLELMKEGMRIARELREHALGVDADLAAGGQIEEGELTFDRELKVARRRTATPAECVAISQSR